MREFQTELAELDSVDLLAEADAEAACEIIMRALSSEDDLVSAFAAKKLEEFAAVLRDEALPAIKKAFEIAGSRHDQAAADAAKALSTLARGIDYFDVAEEIIAEWLSCLYTVGEQSMYDGDEPWLMSSVTSGGPSIFGEPEPIRHAVYEPLSHLCERDPDQIVQHSDRFLESGHSFMRRAYLHILPQLGELEAHRDFALATWQDALGSDRPSVTWVAQGLMAEMLRSAPEETWEIITSLIEAGAHEHDSFIVHALVSEHAPQGAQEYVDRILESTPSLRVAEQIAQWVRDSAEDTPELCHALLPGLWRRLQPQDDDPSSWSRAHELGNALNACAPRCPELVLEILREALQTPCEIFKTDVARAAEELPGGYTAEALGILEVLTTSGDAQVRCTVADVLAGAQFDVGRVLPLLAGLAEDPSPTSDFDPFEGHHPRPSEEDYGHTVMGPRTVREQVALSLAEIAARNPEHEETWGLLRQSSQDEQWAVRYWVFFRSINLAQRSPEQVRAILATRMETEEHPRVRYLMGTLWTQLAWKYPEEAAQEIDRIVRSGDAGLHAGLAELIAHGGLVDERLRATLDWLMGVGSTLVKQRIARRSAELAQTPGFENKQDALAILTQIARDDDPEVRSAALTVVHDATPEQFADLSPVIDAYVTRARAMEPGSAAGMDYYELARYFASVAEAHPETVVGWMETLENHFGYRPDAAFGAALQTARQIAEDPDVKSRALNLLERLADRFGPPFEEMLSATDECEGER